ncbi:MAG TPA: hydroxyacid dehydrogenase, partial [Acidimicrobiales bacterium]|nr:hydroxyacid dehydrogenase [Acidimicrobiales bacterium]
LAADEVGPGALAGVEVLLSGWGAPLMDARFLDGAPDLRVVLYGAGAVRGFVTPAVWERGIRVSSANSANAVPVCEYTTAVVLFSLKHGWRLMRQRPDPRDHAATLSPGAYRSTVGIVGLGTIGRLVVAALGRYDVHLVAFDPYCTASEAEDLGVRLAGLEEVFRESDVVSLHAPLYDATRGLVTGDLLRQLRPGATFINTARGGLVRHGELAQVLAERPDLQAVLDVTDPEPLPADHPLLHLENVVLTPHIAGSIGAECHRMGALVVDELERYVAGQPLQHEVDPEQLKISAIP